jgi:hypothetical protein
MKTQREQILGAAVSTATKVTVGKVVTSVGVKTLRLGHPGLLAGDAVELGSRIVCDTCGVEDRTAETVSRVAGAGATGAVIGAVGGPVGAVIGAGTGFGFWCIGKVASETVSYAIQRSKVRQ